MTLSEKYEGQEPFWVSTLFNVNSKNLDVVPASHENEDWINGHKTEDVVAFLDRLYTAKRKIEKRIVVLGGQDEAVS